MRETLSAATQLPDATIRVSEAVSHVGGHPPPAPAPRDVPLANGWDTPSFTLTFTHQDNLEMATSLGCMGQTLPWQELRWLSIVLQVRLAGDQH